jgi:type II secretory pathway component PulF
MKILLERWNNFVKEHSSQEEFQQELLSIAMKIKEMMPPSEAFRMSREAFKDLVVSIYERDDQTGESWEPYDEDLETILDHLTIEEEESPLRKR